MRTRTGSGMSGRLGALADRQREEEGDAAARKVLGPDASAVRADDALADRQAQTRAAPLARIGLVELLEHLVLAAGRQARAAVGDLDREVLVGGRGDDVQRAACRRVLDGVVEQVD